MPYSVTLAKLSRFADISKQEMLQEASENQSGHVPDYNIAAAPTKGLRPNLE